VAAKAALLGLSVATTDVFIHGHRPTSKVTRGKQLPVSAVYSVGINLLYTHVDHLELLMPSRTRTQTSGPKTLPLQLRLNGSIINTQQTNCGSVSKSCQDFVTPGFRNKLRNGEIVNSPCTISNEVHTAGGGSLNISNGSNTYTVTGGGSLTRGWLQRKGFPTYTNANTAFAPLIRQAKTEALAAVDRAPHSLLEDVLQARETLRLLRDPVETFRKLSLKVQGRVSGLVRLPNYSWGRAMAETYATVQWGYLPLIRSFDTLLTGLTSPTYKRQPGSLQVSYASKHATPIVSEPSLKKSFGAGRYDEYAHYHACDYRVRAYVIYRVLNPIDDWRTTFGLRTKDIPEGLWKILPWSFMVDKVVNVSASIRGLTVMSDPSIEILDGGYSENLSEVETWKFLTQVDPPYVSSVSADTWERTKTLYSRSVWKPGIRDLIPSEGDWKGLVKDATSIADTLAAALLIFGVGPNKRNTSWQ
jgi:hypothetical protein